MQIAHTTRCEANEKGTNACDIMAQGVQDGEQNDRRFAVVSTSKANCKINSHVLLLHNLFNSFVYQMYTKIWSTNCGNCFWRMGLLEDGLSGCFCLVCFFVKMWERKPCSPEADDFFDRALCTTPAVWSFLAKPDVLGKGFDAPVACDFCGGGYDEPFELRSSSSSSIEIVSIAENENIMYIWMNHTRKLIEFWWFCLK